MTWRYQPVYEVEGEELVFSVCEVYFDTNGKLDGWSDPYNFPSGHNLKEFQDDLRLMLTASLLWKPVCYKELKPGMVIEKTTE